MEGILRARARAVAGMVASHVAGIRGGVLRDELAISLRPLGNSRYLHAKPATLLGLAPGQFEDLWSTGRGAGSHANEKQSYSGDAKRGGAARDVVATVVLTVTRTQRVRQNEFANAFPQGGNSR